MLNRAGRIGLVGRQGAQVGPPPPPPVAPAYVSGAAVTPTPMRVGATHVFDPGTWTGATAFEYRVQTGTSLGSPGTIQLDWTAAPEGALSLTAGQAANLFVRGAGPGGSAVAGPFDVGPVASDVVVQDAVVATFAQTFAGLANNQQQPRQTGPFSIPPSAQADRRVYALIVAAGGSSEGISDFTNVLIRINSTDRPMTLLGASTQYADGALRVRAALYEYQVPAGEGGASDLTGVFVAATRPANALGTTQSVRIGIAHAVVVNTGGAAVVATPSFDAAPADTTFAATYSTTSAKRTLLAFVAGRPTLNATAAFAPDAPWTGAFGTNPQANGGLWVAALTRNVATAGPANVGGQVTGAGTPSWELVVAVDLKGDDAP